MYKYLMVDKLILLLGSHPIAAPGSLDSEDRDEDSNVPTAAVARSGTRNVRSHGGRHRGRHRGCFFKWGAWGTLKMRGKHCEYLRNLITLWILSEKLWISEKSIWSRELFLFDEDSDEIDEEQVDL